MNTQLKKYNSVEGTNEMTPAEYLKSEGLPQISEVSDISTVKRTTLHRWWKENPQRFKCMAAGAAAIKSGYDPDGIIDIKDCLLEIKNLIEEKL